MTTTQSEGTCESSSEKTKSPSSEELFASCLDPRGPVALHLRQRLLPADADEDGRGVIYPPTYLDIGYNIDTLVDGTRVATIDAIGSQANRLEPIFKKVPGRDTKNDLGDLVPQIEILLSPKGAKGNDASNSATRRVSLLDLAHRCADAAVLASPTLAVHVAKAFEALRAVGDAGPLCAIAPTSLVFGVWDSRGDSGEKRPRLVRAIVRAWDVEVLHGAAQFNSIGKALDEKQKEELEKARPAKVKLSEKGFADAPAIFRKQTRSPEYRDGAPNPEARVLGGVLAKGPIERDVTINLVALRGLRGADAEGTTRVQTYLFGLSLLAATADLELFLREGCLLRYADAKDQWKEVPRRGKREDLTLPSTDEIRKIASREADYFKSKWPENLAHEHAFDLAEAKKLLATKDHSAPRDAEPG